MARHRDGCTDADPDHQENSGRHGELLDQHREVVRVQRQAFAEAVQTHAQAGARAWNVRGLEVVVHRRRTRGRLEDLLAAGRDLRHRRARFGRLDRELDGEQPERACNWSTHWWGLGPGGGTAKAHFARRLKQQILTGIAS